jgi:hypothetical protein
MNLRRLTCLGAVAWVCLAMFHLRPWRLNNGYVYGGDDYGYLAHLSTWLIDGDLDYANDLDGPAKRNQYPNGHRESYAVGSAYIVAPAYWLGLQLDKLTGRTAGLYTTRNYSKTWTIVFYLLAQQTLAVLGLWFLALCLLEELKIEFPYALLALCGVLASFLPIYVFRRPMAHVAEFFLSSLWLYYFFRHSLRSSWTIKRAALWGMMAGFLMATRWNDIQFFLFGAAFFSLWIFRPSRARLLALECSYIGAASAVFIALQGFNWFKTFGTFFPSMNRVYATNVSHGLFHGLDLSTLGFIAHVFTGMDWGLFWTSSLIPFGLLSLIGVGGILCRIPATKSERGLIQFVLGLGFALILYGVAFSVQIQSQIHGSYYGYRYLTGILAPSVILLAVFLSDLMPRLEKSTRIGIYIMLGLFFCFGAALAIPFEGNATTLTLESMINPFGISVWDNTRYVANAWGAIQHPFQWGRALAAGPLGVLPGWCVVVFKGSNASPLLTTLGDKYSGFATDAPYLFMSTILLTFWGPAMFWALYKLKALSSQRDA